MLHRVLHFSPDDIAGGTATTEPARGAVMIDDPALHAEAGETIATTETGVGVKKSGVEKGAIDVSGAGKAFLAALGKSGDITKAAAAVAKGEKTKGARTESSAAGTTATKEQGTAEERAEAGEEREASAATGEETADEQTVREAAEAAEAELAALETADETTARHASEKAATEKEDKVKRGKEAAGAAAKTIVLAGHGERGEKDIEVEIDDPEIADRLERLSKDGLRRRQFDERMKKVDARVAELRTVDQALERDPVGYAINRMTPVRQVEVAKAILTERWDELVPFIQELDGGDAARLRLRIELRDKLTENSKAASATAEREQYIADVMGAVRALVPEGTDDETGDQFMADADQDLAREANAGRKVTVAAVAKILERRMKMYGFEPPADGASESGGTRASRTGAEERSAASARPLSPRAKELAKEKLATARAAQDRIKRQLESRRGASRVAPAGTGTGAISRDLVPSTADVRETSRILRKNGKLSQTWPTG